MVKPAKAQGGKTSGGSSAAVSEIGFSSLEYTAPDSSVQVAGVTYQITDQAFMNKAWDTLTTDKWTATALPAFRVKIILYKF